MQAWFWRRFHHAVPYRLFALSNFASLLALLAYPVAIEPFFSLVSQSISWSTAYAVFAVLCALTAISTARHATGAAQDTAPAVDESHGPSPSFGERALWVALSASGSCLLLAITNHLTQNVASIPFLWVVPLSLYLVTFILCFDHPRWYVRPLFLAAAAVLLPVMAWYSESLHLWLAAPLYAGGLFVCCMVCHGELYRMRPGPGHLTTFYLMIAVGGALGALMVGLAAPSVLPGYYELGITLVVCAALFAWRTRGAPWWMTSTAVAVLAATVAFAVHNVRDYRTDTRVMVRNFYGVVRTRDFQDPVAVSRDVSRRHQSRRPASRRCPSARADDLLQPEQRLRARVREPGGHAAQGRHHRSRRRRAGGLRAQRRSLPLLRDRPAGRRRRSHGIHLPARQPLPGPTSCSATGGSRSSAKRRRITICSRSTRSRAIRSRCTS